MSRDEPTIIIGGDVQGVHHQKPHATRKRIKEGKGYRDLSTVMVVPTRGEIPVRCVQAWMDMVPMMNQPFVRMFIEKMEVAAAYNAAVETILNHPALQGFKYMLTVEEDNAPPPDGLHRLFESIDEYAIVAGLYYTKGDGGQPMIYGDPKGLLTFQPQVPKVNAVQECVAPETQVLMADLSWRPASEVMVGDEIVAVDEHSPGARKRRRLIRAFVEDRHDFVGERVTVETDRCEITVSRDHQFLVDPLGTQGSGLRWVEAQDLDAGRKIRFLTSPWPDRSDSWLSGLIDGEGSILNYRAARGVLIAQNPGAVLDRAKEVLVGHGVGFTDHAVAQHKWTCRRLHITAIGDFLAALGQYRPTRFSGVEILDGSLTLPKQKAVVARVEDDGRGDLIAFKTSSGTLITDGLVSHNCNGTGMGFTLFDMQLFKDDAIPKPWFRTLSEWTPEGGARVGTQDLYFMGNVRRAGYRIASDNRVKVGHYDAANRIMW